MNPVDKRHDSKLATAVVPDVPIYLGWQPDHLLPPMRQQRAIYLESGDVHYDYIETNSAYAFRDGVCDENISGQDVLSPAEAAELRDSRHLAVERWLQRVDCGEELAAVPSGRQLTGNEIERRQGVEGTTPQSRLRDYYRRLRNGPSWNQDSNYSLLRFSNGAVDEYGTPYFMTQVSSAHRYALGLTSICRYLNDKDVPKPGPGWPVEDRADEGQSLRMQ